MNVIFKNERVKEKYSVAFIGKWRYYSSKEKEALAALNVLVDNAQSLQDLRTMPPLHLELLEGKIKNRKRHTGEWSIRVVGTQYRVIFIPCDNENNEMVGGDILAQATTIKIIKVTEVSKHYE